MAYSTLAGDLFLNAITVVDRYQLFIHINKALDTTRKLLRKTFPENEDFRNLRWALLKNPAKLSDDENQTLQKAFDASPQL